MVLDLQNACNQLELEKQALREQLKEPFPKVTSIGHKAPCIMHPNLPLKYSGERTDVVLYADMPSSGNVFTAHFRDAEVNVKDIKVFDSYEGVFEGDPDFISKNLLDEAIEKAASAKGLTCKVIYPQWKNTRWPLPPYRYALMIKLVTKSVADITTSDSFDWYYLKLVWFDDAPAENQSLSDYINSVTSQLDFFAITRKLTEDEKDYWC